jgi:hypothetical protein
MFSTIIVPSSDFIFSATGADEERSGSDHRRRRLLLCHHRESGPAQTLKDLIGYSKANSGKAAWLAASELLSQS